ncbi:trans-1,2-dihydrobenzene-1,2-diol dehydrogenase-like [Ischnura elegans]|uniref:trans-1,2-dihydrobenzene-1,2-diol dehydrogenase-like n=1 Tax=Ischnura elegans TaxID=197161 RepID=UPI001ED88692|nr:trans-1,2-dihydrobenzene-1,2-diol dehydrogenase-like [Ischnura elegans]XP_046388286.1 trans-1,2-dihydrobenzene-1,2-diol dehydrogenase-like [Ischnura elegans]XP_046388287.1 trans-1,2-dihydrobenzene-1,2-diol dehydrogenase-like [Ischnura elegans]
MATRWGIASAGKISHDFVTALSTLSTDEHQVVAVAARDLDRAKEFAARHRIPTAYGSYDKLAKDPNVEVVYVGSINPHHKAVSLAMLAAGKHVLCEKPLCMNERETRELVNEARERKVFLMEAVWSRCLPAYECLKKELELGVIGEALQVVVTFGVKLDNVDRVWMKELGGGTTLDIGIYCLQLAMLVFGSKTPCSVKAVGHLNANGVDESTSVVITYPRGQTATLVTHARVELPNEALVVGTKGSMKLSSPFWSPTNLRTPEKTRDFYLPSASQPFNFMNSAGLRYEAMEVRRCLQQGLLESPKMTLNDSIKLASLMDEVRRQVGVVYPQD